MSLNAPIDMVGPTVRGWRFDTHTNFINVFIDCMDGEGPKFLTLRGSRSGIEGGRMNFRQPEGDLRRDQRIELVPRLEQMPVRRNRPFYAFAATAVAGNRARVSMTS